MNPAAEQLEVVAQHEQWTDHDEHEQSGSDRGHADEAERARDQQTTGSEPDEPSGRNRGAQRPAVQLVECVGRDADGEEEREQRPDEAYAVGVRCKRRADDDVREVPRRIRRVKQRPPIAPAPRAPRRTPAAPCSAVRLPSPHHQSTAAGSSSERRRPQVLPPATLGWSRPRGSGRSAPRCWARESVLPGSTHDRR